MRQLLCALCLGQAVLICAPAFAAPPVNSFSPAETGVNAALLSGNPTMTLRISGYAQLTLYLALTRVAATALAVSCTAGPTASLQAPLSVAQVSGGSVALVDASFAWASVSSSRLYRMILAPLNDNLLVCTFSGSGATTDTVSVYARAAGVL